MTEIRVVLVSTALFLFFYSLFGIALFISLAILYLLAHTPVNNTADENLSIRFNEREEALTDRLDDNGETIAVSVLNSEDEGSDGQEDQIGASVTRSSEPSQIVKLILRHESSSSNMNILTTKVTKLSRILNDALVSSKAASHHLFIPRSDLDTIITQHKIEEEIKIGNVPIDGSRINNCVSSIILQAKRVFAILVCIHRGVEICNFTAGGFHDDMLPITVSETHGKVTVWGKNKKSISVFENWDLREIKKFEGKQWRMIAPEFKKGDHMDLDEDTILPFINVRKEEERRGGYGKVSKILIHPDHHEFSHLTNKGFEYWVAIKKLETDQKTDFEKESQILRKLNRKTNAHLIKLLCTFQLNNKYHLVFPCADSNLREYWEHFPCPEFNKKNVLWTMRQFVGITKALNLIHNFSATIPLEPEGEIRLQNNRVLEVDKKEKLWGRHGDIKPENILLFKECPNGTGKRNVLVISDFGLGRFHGRDSRSNIDPLNAKASPTYEPPECELGTPVSRAYDIWSLGCLFLEFVTWLLKGEQWIEVFSERRGLRGPAPSDINEDKFFTITRFLNDEKRAEVRQPVKQWSTGLRGEPNCSNLLKELIELIMNHLLVINPKDRITSGDLQSRLIKMLEEAEKNDTYLTSPGSDASSYYCISNMPLSTEPRDLLGRSSGTPRGNHSRKAQRYKTSP